MEACKKRWGREKMEGRGKGKRLRRNQRTNKKTKEREPRTKPDSMQRCRASTQRDAATPLTKTRRPGEYLKTRLACAIERSEVDKPGRRVQHFVGLKGWWRCGRWQSRGNERSWPPPAKPIETVFYVKLCDDLCRGLRTRVAYGIVPALLEGLGEVARDRLLREIWSTDPRGRVIDPLHEEIQLTCLLYTSPSPRDLSTSRMPSSA